MWWLTPPETPRWASAGRFAVEQAFRAIDPYPLRLEMDRKTAGVAAAERRSWAKWYGERFSGTVLDVGAGCGETAAWFMEHGASSVVCVEADPMKAGMLRRNGFTDVIARRFRLSDLLIPHDFLKVDIEGGERLLLDWEGDIRPCAIEAHAILSGRRDIASALSERFHLKPVARVSPTCWILRG